MFIISKPGVLDALTDEANDANTPMGEMVTTASMNKSRLSFVGIICKR